MSSFSRSKSDRQLTGAVTPLIEDLESRRLLATGDFGAVTTLGGSGIDNATHVVTDRLGSIIVVGRFETPGSTTMDFDPGTDNWLLSSKGGDDIFVAKYGSAGGLVWAVSAGGAQDDEAGSVVVDGDGNIYVGGTFRDEADFRPGRRQRILKASGNGSDAFIWKLNADGQLVWVMRPGGAAGDDGINSLALDAAGNVHAAGFFQNAATFGRSTIVTGTTGRNAFAAKFSGAGVLAWARHFGSTAVETETGVATPSADGRAIGVDSSGNVYVGGVFNHQTDFDPGAGTTNITTTADSGGKHGLSDAFVVKLSNSGALTWAKAFGGNGADDLTGLALGRATDATPTVHTTGSYTGTANFDPNAGTTNLTSAGGTDIFVSRIDTAGNLDWARSMGGSGADSGNAITVDKFGNVFTTGNFNTSGDFDPGAATVTLSSGSNLNHGFVSRLTDAGNFAYAKGLFVSTSGQAGGSGIALADGGALWSVGSYAGTVDFDPGTASQSRTSTSSTADLYFLRIVR